MDYVKRYADAGLQSKLVTAKINKKTRLRSKASRVGASFI